MFIKPHHFQQHWRYIEYVDRRRADASNAYQYGFEKLNINRENLLHGKISLVDATGIFPDRTVFEIPHETPSPIALDVSGITVNDEIVYLATPLWTNGIAEVTEFGAAGDAARFKRFRQEVRDATSEDAEPYELEVAQLNVRLMLARQDRSSYSCIPLCRIREKRTDGAIVLDAEFMPMACTVEAVPQLRRALDDFTGLLQQRAKQIAARLGALAQGGVADVADFMMLQTINRLGPQFRHLISINGVHPERLYETFLTAAGELATFTHESRLPETWLAYNHEEPHLCFEPVIASLRRSLSVMLEPNAIALPMQKHKYGIITAALSDPSIIRTCVFVLAAKAAVPVDRLAKIFPAQVKVSSIEKIRDLINLHLPGVTLQPMPTAPRQLPYHAGYTYFMLDQNSVGWSNLHNASGFAFHIAGDFPELDMQFWAIRGRREGGLQ